MSACNGWLFKVGGGAAPGAPSWGNSVTPDPAETLGGCFDGEFQAQANGARGARHGIKLD